jgi:hypothetical protein
MVYPRRNFAFEVNNFVRVVSWLKVKNPAAPAIKTEAE